MTKHKLILLSLLIILIAIFFIFGLTDYFSLDYFKAKQASVDNYYNSKPIHSGVIFVSIYIILTSLSLPAAGIMTLIGGAIFGLIWGLILVSIASSSGATLAFLLSRYLFRDTVQKQFSDHLGPINEGIKNDGAFYLFTLRMVPIFPYFMINATMALTPMRTGVFFLVTLIGMLPVTALLVNAGLEISRIESFNDIFSNRLIVTLALLGIFPLLAKKTIELIKSRRNLVTTDQERNEEL